MIVQTVGRYAIVDRLGTAEKTVAVNSQAYNLYLQGLYLVRRRQSGGDFERAIDYPRQAVDLEANYALAWVGLAYARTNQTSNGYLPFDEGQPLADFAIGRALERFIEETGARFPSDVAEIHAFRGDNHEAFTWLDRAYEQRESTLRYVKVEPFLRNLHDDPRWRPFLEKIGLAD
jgi:hypothetical protein